MIPLFHLQEFMSLISIQGKLRAFATCSIFYINSHHVTWILYQVPPKLMVALMPIILRVNPKLSLIFTSALSVSSFDIAMVAPPLDLKMYPPMYYLMRDHMKTPPCSLGPLSFVE
ncbi:hypothetical protein BHE74_00037201 [Ensete ventricosum]|nr:hypothetical protein GW17_00011206 [Ensete ventricosum]RWW56103.1 hypothetical protein BHE74_00037201 [Ensete ventricosum]RZR96284.1 hypothetical protein BHM03_00025273 [Ensete ventricosum]